MLTASQAEPSATFAAALVAEQSEVQAGVLPASPPPPPAYSAPVSQIELELLGGRRIRVGHDVDIDLLRRLIVALEPAP